MILALLTAAVLAAPASLPPADAENGGLTLPAGFRAQVVADDLGPLRFLTVAPSGDLYVKTRDAGILALRDTNGDGRTDVKETFGTGGGTGIALAEGWLYHSTNSAVYRYRLAKGELVPKGEPETIVSGLPSEHQHDAKSFAFGGDGQLYVEVGSPSNAYGDPDRRKGAKGKDPSEFLKTHGGFWRFDPARNGQTQADGFHYSTGHRHVLAVAWNAVSKTFFIVMMGRDQLSTVAPDFYTDADSAELPAEEMHVLREGTNVGWPFTYWDPAKKARMLAPEFGGDNKKKAEAGKYPDPLVAFPAHWAPLQMAFYTGEAFPAKYRGGAFVAFHGSWNRAPLPQAGYNVAFVPFDAKGMPLGTYEVFADGFAAKESFTNPGDARFRPCGVAMGPDGALYVSDSDKGRIWRVTYAGDAAASAATPRPSARVVPRAQPLLAPKPAKDPGAVLYAQTCAVCHMADGRGVPGRQPALRGSAVVGETETFVKLLLEGADAALPSQRPRNQNEMPVFADLSDAEIASVITYVRREHGGGAAPVTPAQVAAIRAKASRGSAPRP